jgi:hypothetical protein
MLPRISPPASYSSQRFLHLYAHVQCSSKLKYLLGSCQTIAGFQALHQVENPLPRYLQTLYVWEKRHHEIQIQIFDVNYVIYSLNPKKK